MNFENKRKISLMAAFLIVAFLGITYAWSVFQKPLMARYGWTAGQVSLSFTLNFVTTMFASPLLGRNIRSRLSIRKIVLVGILFFGTGFIANGFIRGSIWELYFFFGFMCAMGSALVYPQLVAYAMELFPERSGFAGGLIAAGFGSGSIIWAPLAAYLLKSFDNMSHVFLLIGGAFAAIMLVLSFFLSTPPKDLSSLSPSEVPTETESPIATPEYTTAEMIRSPLFYIMMFSLIIGLACGSMILIQASPIVQFQFNVDETSAAAVVSILAVANMAGRFFIGFISDFLGKIGSLILTGALMLVSMLGLSFLTAQLPFSAMMVLSIFSYGGFASLVAAVTGALFGEKNMSANYSVSFSSFGLSSLLGPVLISRIWEQTGSYRGAYLIGIVLAAIGLVVSIFLFFFAKKKQAAERESLSTT